MRVFIVGVLLACLHAVHSQSLRHSGENFPNNSFINRGIVSMSNNLECLTNHSPCCDGTAVGGWRDPTRGAIQEGAGGTSPFYVTRATGAINLNRLPSSNGQEQLSGMYQCQIPGSSGDLEELFIYLGNQSTGQLTSAEVSFTELLSQVNEEPMFVLTCRSQGGPATTVEWIRGSTAISDPSTALVLVASQQNTMYDSRLTVSGRELGDYSCTVSSNRDDYFGEAVSSVSSGAFTVIAAAEPTRLNAVDLLDTERILVTWTAPSGPITGYTVFLEPGGVQETAPAAATSHIFTNVQSGMSYMVTIVALSDQLPSRVVGPVSPTTLVAPTVDLSTTATEPEVDGDLSLNCIVTLPDDIEISGNPLVEFFGPGDGTEEGPFDPDTITPLGSSKYLAMYTFEDLDLFSNGDYRCSATYTIEGGNSPPGSDTLTVDVLFESDDPGLEIEGVPYVSNAISLTCAAFISGEEYSIEFVWTKDGGDVPSSTSMGSPPDSSFITTSELIFSSLALSDSGEYQCQVTVSIAATTGNVPTQTVTESITLNVLTPTVTVNTDPESQRVLDHEDYNSYTINCSAIARAGTSPLELGPVVWECSFDSIVFSAVAMDSYTSLEGSPEEGYTSVLSDSVLSGSECTPSTSVQFRCTTQLSSTNNFSNSSISTVTVQCPVAPMSVGLRSTDVTDTTADISWTVPSIAYTPETYVVLYGTTRDNLDRVSSQMATSGTDISVTLPLTLRLSGLEPDTAYYYTVNASNSFSFTLYETNSFNTTSRRPNPPTNLTVECPSDSLTYQFSWTASTDAPGAPPIVSYIVTCDPSLDGVDSVKYTTPDDSTTSGSLTLPPGLSFNCCVVAISEGVGPSDRNCIDPLMTPSTGRSSSDEGDFPVVVVVVVVVLVVVIVLLTVVVVVIVVIIRRKKSGGYKAQNLSPSLDEKISGGSGEEMVSLSAVNPTSPEEAARMKPIELGRFEEHVRQMHEDRDKGFELEYQTFSTEPTAVHEEAQDPKNKTKNRFANIFPYDFNRVPLQHMDGAEGSDYINASFVHGYSRSNAYIAAQGPMSGTILDFWRMIWEHRPATIVMLTKQVEGGKRKCELYWPEKVGETFKPGSGLHVEYKEVIPFADFEIKKFIVTNAQKSKVPALEVQHFQFLSWPDHGVPKFSTALISFIRRLRQYHNPQSSMLVHCSAGVGRTGAFILLDSMLERLASESSMNVYEFLMRMRKQRVHLVQTLAQYVFIHDALVELITCGDTSVPASELRKHIKKMSQKEGDGSGFTVQLRLLARVSRKPSDNDNSDGLAPHNKDKNRYPGRVPYNMNRVRLRPTGVSGSEYINASFLDGYKQKNMYMAAQAPVASTVNDFWRMVWEFKSRAVVMLCQLEENGQEMSQEYWPTQPNAKQLYGKNSVKLLSEEHSLGAKEIVVRKFDITDEKNTASFTVTQYHVLCWPEEGKMAPGLLLHLISELNKLQRNTGNMPITVVCNDGMGRTGAFICIHAMLDRVNSEHIVDFFQFIKSSRINRPDIVRAEEHYVMCHEAVAEYLDSFQMYANFT